MCIKNKTAMILGGTLASNRRSEMEIKIMPCKNTTENPIVCVSR